MLDLIKKSNVFLVNYDYEISSVKVGGITMNHSVKVSGNCITVALTGKIYSQDAAVVRDELLEEIDRGVINISIDLSELTYIDSTGLGVLVTLHKRTKEKNGKLILTGAQGLVEQLLKRTRLDKIFCVE